MANVPRWLKWLAALAVAFGILTIIVGGGVLFGSDDTRRAAGNVVPWILWSNFLGGFAYVVAGIGLWRGRRWAATLSAAIATVTIAFFIAFSLHVLSGAPFEPRTVGAMALRSALWGSIAIAACLRLGCRLRI